MSVFCSTEATLGGLLAGGWSPERQSRDWKLRIFIPASRPPASGGGWKWSEWWTTPPRGSLCDTPGVRGSLSSQVGEHGHVPGGGAPQLRLRGSLSSQVGEHGHVPGGGAPQRHADRSSSPWDPPRPGSVHLLTWLLTCVLSHIL